MNLETFGINFFKGIEELFKSLNIPVNIIDDKEIAPKDILTNTYKENNESFCLIEDVIAFGMIDDSAFTRKNIDKSLDGIKIPEKDYEGILIFGVTLKKRNNGLLPTRTQLAEITRAFNREYHYTPVVTVFRYEKYISIANIERIPYKQEYREGEKTGKVSLLRDINVKSPHTGHLKILQELTITRSGKNAVNNFSDLYKYWQKVFSVSILNKKFYKELSDWYFWAMDEIYFPDAPFQTKFIAESLCDQEVREHNAKNLIRMLTRILFVWFIKEKSLIPEELFDENYIKSELLKNFEPKKNTILNKKTQGSMYYRAILQNLFFATLNQDMKKREFRKSGNEMNITNLMRYKEYFKDPDTFIHLVEDFVPFMNGGLFECLDKPIEGKKGKWGGDVIRYIDGFSDRYDNELKVPDCIFFGKEEHVNLSEDYGQGKSKNKDVEVKGLINILKSYKFTIDESTPVEQDIALDPELLGRVFENLLASYNPETKTTARKQTGSFYTPREIVNYMVDESLVAHLKKSLRDCLKDEKEIDYKLHQLLSYDDIQPFKEEKTKEILIQSLDMCKILDPACGSGAFPMGALQKMVHIIHKIDPKNERWQKRQIKKVECIEDIDSRERAIEYVKEAFENNQLGYGRKLYLIENCIHGVDIQPIAVQISKLRFFISLIVDQKVNKEKPNLGIRPLPNLETKFVSANTLIKLETKKNSLFNKEEIRTIEKELKNVRHRLFSAKKPSKKRKLRKEDKELREQITVKLEKSGCGNETARTLAHWDPYDQNESATFFDPEWMFDVTGGFDIVIGNPPYMQLQNAVDEKYKYADIYKDSKYVTFERTGDIYVLFYERGLNILCPNGFLCYITSNKWMRTKYGKSLRKFFSENNPLKLIDLGPDVFSSATVDTNILLVEKTKLKEIDLKARTLTKKDTLNELLDKEFVRMQNVSDKSWVISNKSEQEIRKHIEKVGTPLKDWDISINRGILTGFNEAFIIDGEKRDEFITKDPKNAEIIKPILRGRDIKRYKAEFADLWLLFIPWHFPLNSNKNISGVSSEAEKTFENEYNVIYRHLLKYKERLSKRNKAETGIRYEWYALQRCAATYYKEFEKEKIVFQEMVQESSFVYDESGSFFTNDTGRIITGKNIKFLTSILNSCLFFYSVKMFYGGGALGKKGIRMKHTFFEKFPIPQISKEKQNPFLTLVDLIVFTKESETFITSDVFESVVDALVLNLYFSEHMIERSIDVLKFVKNDVKVILQNKEFKNLTYAEKDSVVRQLHEKWTYSGNEIVKRMVQFKEKSPDILKLILDD
ncbi:MAG: Eco57I restriction-modification methylase domain-containing protein [Caldisericia bacterium]|nr:Eco57I restriction-modification methylase domain-containing protein [Caldisericia bacterium]